MKCRKHLVLQLNWFKDYKAQYRMIENLELF